MPRRQWADQTGPLCPADRRAFTLGQPESWRWGQPPATPHIILFVSLTQVFGIRMSSNLRAAPSQPPL